MHYSKKFIDEVWRPVSDAVKECGGVTPEVRKLFRDRCIAIGHEERVRNLYRIKDKLSTKAVFFKPNGPQEKYLETKKGRDIILKTRQIGFTTLSCVRAYDYALWEPNMSTGIMAHLQTVVTTIFEDILKFCHTHFKNDWGTYYSPTEKSDSKNSLSFSDDGCGRVLNSSMRVLYDFRGKTVNFLHVAEAAFVDNERLLGSLQAVPVNGEVVLESTPNGRGGEFYRQWQNWKTMTTLAPYKGHFVPWFTFYPEKPEDWDWPEGLTPTEYEKNLKEAGVPESGLAWRRWCIEANCLGDSDKFENEYPSDDQSCFFTGEALVFPTSVIKQQAKNTRPPTLVGFLLPNGAKYEWAEDAKGTTSIWDNPQIGLAYVIGADSSSGLSKDRAVAYVKCRQNGRTVAKIEGYIEPNDFADEIFKLATYYNKAWICAEENNHGHVVIQRLKEKRYSNLYRRKVYDEMTNKPTKKIGFLTTNETKLQITEQLKNAAREGAITILDSALIDEMSTFTQFAGKNGRTIRREATAGAHDDRVMAACFTEEMDRVLGPLNINEDPVRRGEIDPETGFSF